LIEKDPDKARKRRRREFTRPETLVRHPIITLFDTGQVKAVLSLRNEQGLRFRDFQYLLCNEQPARKIPKDCRRVENCGNCDMFRRCKKAEYGIWSMTSSGRFFRPEKIYDRKSHLADDLRRLCEEGYLRKGRRGYYERAEGRLPEDSIAFKKRTLSRLLDSCPPDLIHLREDACLLFMTNDMLRSDEDEIRKLDTSIQLTKNTLLELTMKCVLANVTRSFQDELSRLKNDRKKVYLFQYLVEHISTRLGSLGLDEEQFKNELAAIKSTDLGLSVEKRAEIERTLRGEKEGLFKAKQRISKALWLSGSTDSTTEKVELLTLEPLFRMRKESEEWLKEGDISHEFRSAFENNHGPLAPNAHLTRVAKDAWALTDQDRHYVIRDTGRSIIISRRKEGEEFDVAILEKLERLLKEEEDFQKWFDNTDMRISLEMAEETPLVVVGL
jgi:hypothetical protein